MTHEFKSNHFHEAYRDMLNWVLTFGEKVSPRGEGTLEIRDVVLELTPDSDDAKAWGRMSDKYLLAEFAWYLSKDPSVEFIKAYASLWGRIQNPDGTANSNYGEKLWGMLDTGSEWDWCRTLLRRDAFTRQAIAVINRPGEHWLGNKDVPCTLTLGFMARGEGLELRVHMRSSDAWFGLPYDVPFFRWLQRRMADEIGLPVGKLRLSLDSFHIYEARVEPAWRYVKSWRPSARWVNPVPHDVSLESAREHAEDCLAAVEHEQELTV